jgi:ABC-type hemin transport system ATPase subunit
MTLSARREVGNAWTPARSCAATRPASPPGFVTHDQDEAMELADLVVVMSMGRIEQIGTPRDIRTRPATRFVAHFVST